MPPPLKARPDVKPIAFYLPQFHPIEVNDENWGRGFTEWNNVVRGAPEARDHHQPRVPADFGFYDLRLKDVQVRQSEAAKAAGLAAFCYYYYWFDGNQPMLMPLENHAGNRRISLEFCLCFANENWTRTWDGLDREVILKQEYGKDFEARFWNDILRFLKSEKYLRNSEGKPILLVYKPSIIPDFDQVAANLKQMAIEAGFPGLYLVGNMAFSDGALGLDAIYEFPPLGNGSLGEREFGGPVAKTHVHGRSDDSASVFFDYRQFVVRERRLARAPQHIYPCVMPSWDNTARRPRRGSVFLDSTPEAFSDWVELAARRAGNTKEKLLFVNAWNEWAEGAYLEPDQRYGWGYLNAFRKGLSAARRRERPPQPICVFAHIHYPDVWEEISALIAERIREPFYLVVTTSRTSPIRPPSSRFLKGFEVHRHENRGRDILPFLKALQQTKFQFEIGLKLHTKRSLHRVDGDEWRQFLVADLMPENNTEDICDLFREDPNLGFVSPGGHWASVNAFIGSNAEGIRQLQKAWGIADGDCDIETGRFIMGSMFWFRRKALEGLGHRQIARMFAEERGQLDGTAAHAAERLFALAGEKRGFFVATTRQVPSLLAEVRAGQYSVERRASLFSDQLTPVEAARQVAREDAAAAAFDIARLYRRLPLGFRLWMRRLMRRPVVLQPGE